MKKILTSALLSATILGAGLVVSSNVNAATVDQKATTNTDVKFVGGTDPIDPVDPTDPTKPTKPTDPGTGNQGPLAIIYATKDISFGQDNKITATKATLTADKNIAVEVGDVRGNNAGWALSVKSDQLSDGATTAPKVLKGAVISLAEGASVVANSGTSVKATTKALSDTITGGVVLDAAGIIKDTGESQGSGINVDTIAKDGITLTVPAGSATADVAYKSVLTWTLSDVPA